MRYQINTQGLISVWKRSWNRNFRKLKNLMIKDKKFVEHGCELEKVLGYKYSTLEDILQISGSSVDQSVNTKSKSPIEWPRSELQCLSSKNKFIVKSTSLNYAVTNNEPQPVIPFDKYSGFNKQINVTTNTFKIRNKLKHVGQDPNNSTKIYLP